MSEIRNITNDFKSFAQDAAQKTQKVIREVSMHFPKTIVIATVANTIFTILTASLSGYIGLALNCYLLYSHRNHILTAIDVHSENNISEWNSSYREKEDLIPQIEARVAIRNIAQSISRFFNRLF